MQMPNIGQSKNRENATQGENANDQNGPIKEKGESKNFQQYGLIKEGENASEKKEKKKY